VKASKELLACYKDEPADLRADCDWGRDLNSPLGPRIQAGFHGVEAPQFFTTKKVSNSTVGWQDHGDDFLGLVGCLFIDYMLPKTTISGQYYAALMDRLRESIKEKRRGKLRKVFCFCMTMPTLPELFRLLFGTMASSN